MKNHLLIAAVIAVLCIAASSRCPCSHRMQSFDTMQSLRIKRWEVVTNIFLQHDNRDPHSFQTMEYRPPFLVTNHVTNIVIGNERKELFRVEAMK